MGSAIYRVVFEVGEAEEGLQGAGGTSHCHFGVDWVELPVSFHVYGCGGLYHA